MARLLARSGPETGLVFNLTKEVTAVGRSPTNDLVLNDNGVSRFHARIKRRGELYEVEDLKSTHGTFVNDALIAGEQVLKDTDLLRFGRTEFLFKAGVSARVTEDTVPRSVGNGSAQTAADNEMAMYLDSTATRVPNAPSPEDANLSGWRLDVLSQVVDSLQSATSEEDLLGALMDVLFDAFKPDRGAIFLSREPGGTLVQRLARPDLAETPISKSIVHYAVTRQMSLMVPDVVEDERFRKTSSVLQHSIRGVLCSPLIRKAKILGVVYLDRRVEPFEDNRENLTLLNIMATHTAITLENAMLAQAEKAREERFRIVAESVSDVIYEWDLKDKVDWYGDVDSLMGYPAGGFPRTLGGWAAALHPEDKKRVWAAVDGQLKGAAPYNVEYRLAGKDGRWRWWSARGVLLGDERGEPKRWLGAVTDITEHKRAEEVVRESEAKYRTLVENIPQKVFMKDRDSRWVSINERFARDLGIRPEETVGKTDFDFFPREMAEKYRANDRRIMDTGQTEEVEEIYLEKDRETWVQTIRTPIRGPSGEITGVLGIFWDITERKRAEEELERPNQQHKLILSSAAEGILGLGLRGNHTFANSAAARMLGYEAEELLGRPSHSTWHHTRADGTSYPREECFIYAAYRDGVVHRSSTEVFWRKDGTSFPVEYASTPIYEQGRLAGAVVTFADITERKRAEAERGRLEEQVRVSQKMETIGNLAGGVAHDFNNLLSVILGYTEFAIEEARENDLLKDNLLEVKKAGERAAALTRQLLAFGRKQVLQPVPLSLNEIAVGIEKMLRRILGEDIDFVQFLAPDLGVVRADPGQIEQVLMNLVVNARDAMPGGGNLTIETSNVELDEEYVTRHLGVQPGSYVQLAVTDTGSGMDEQTQTRVFEPFFTTKEKGRGTGLGLSTVYGIVKQSGGNIRVYSELGRGTTFKIYLPRDLSDTAAAAAKPSSVPRRTTRTETILVVEDEEGLRKIAQKALDAAGYKVLTAANGEEALGISAQHAGDIHLLLTDAVMPGMSGRVLAERLTKSGRHSKFSTCRATPPTSLPIAASWRRASIFSRSRSPWRASPRKCARR